MTTVHKFGVTPVELYRESAIGKKQKQILKRCYDWEEISSASLDDIYDANLLRVLAPFGSQQENEHALARCFLGDNGDAKAEYMLPGRTGVLLLHHQKEVLRLGEPVDAFELADRLTLWLERDRAALATRLRSSATLKCLKSFVPAGERDLIADREEYAFVFAAVDLGGGDSGEVLRKIDLFRTVLSSMEFLEEIGEVDVFSGGSMQELRGFLESKFAGLSPEKIRKAQRSRYDRLRCPARQSALVVEMLEAVAAQESEGVSGLRGLRRDLAEAALPHRDHQHVRSSGWSDEHLMPSATLKNGESRWLRARWDTVLLATTNNRSIRELVAMEVALQAVWNEFASASGAIPRKHAGDRTDDDFEDRLLDRLSDTRLRVTNWQVQLSEWQRRVFTRLRETSRLDDNIAEFYRASEESVRRSEVVREKERAEREKRFHWAATVAGLALAALVLGEITISIAGPPSESGEVQRSVAVFVSVGTIALSLWLVAQTFEVWPRWQRWLVGGLALVVLAAMGISRFAVLPGLKPAHWLFPEPWWPWPGLPSLGLIMGVLAGIVLARARAIPLAMLAWVRAKVCGDTEPTT